MLWNQKLADVVRALILKSTWILRCYGAHFNYDLVKSRVKFFVTMESNFAVGNGERPVCPQLLKQSERYSRLRFNY
jgi:hypothetical protein